MNNFKSLTIRELCSQKHITLKKLANEINVTENGLQAIFKNNTTSIDTLLKIANYFKVPVGYFFTDDNTSTMNAVGEPETKYNTDCNCDELKSTLATKNQIIEELQFNYNALKLTVELLERQIEILRGEK